jgi:hypothetical protein
LALSVDGKQSILRAWQGHRDSAVGAVIATLDPPVYITPTLLTIAHAPTAPAAIVGVSGNTLTVNVASLPVGTVFEVFVTASVGAETTRTGFVVTVTA